MRKTLVSALSMLVVTSLSAQQQPSWANEMIAFRQNTDEHVIMGATSIQSGIWDELPQPQFWQQIMQLSPDSVLVNIGSTRKVVARMSSRCWNALDDAHKTMFRDSVKQSLGLPVEERILVTTGKNDFYRFDLVFESLPLGVAYFDEYGVDPWYAQSILLIESPGQIKKSSVGAYGPFQLMPNVARSMGLTVNKTVDERKDFARSAYGAAQLLKRVCIPSARAIASDAGLVVDEQAIWFRLLVMHVYHAGALNVKAVVNAIGKVENGDELIRKMWVTTAASFGNASQNYSQLALAAHLQLDALLRARQGQMYSCAMPEEEGQTLPNQ